MDRFGADPRYRCLTTNATLCHDAIAIGRLDIVGPDGPQRHQAFTKTPTPPNLQHKSKYHSPPPLLQNASPKKQNVTASPQPIAKKMQEYANIITITARMNLGLRGSSLLPEYLSWPSAVLCNPGMSHNDASRRFVTRASVCELMIFCRPGFCSTAALTRMRWMGLG